MSPAEQRLNQFQYSNDAAARLAATCSRDGNEHKRDLALQGGMAMEHLPSVRHLRHLMALADHGHFSRAADACHITQSTLSASIKELENVLQATLVDRSKRTVVLTPLGV